MDLETTSTMVTMNMNTSNQVELSMNKMDKEIILVTVTIIHKLRTNILEQQMNITKIMLMITLTTTTMTKI